MTGVKIGKRVKQLNGFLTGNISIGVFAVNVKGGKSGKNALTSESRIKFTIPVNFVIYNPVDSEAPPPDIQRTTEDNSLKWL